MDISNDEQSLNDSHFAVNDSEHHEQSQTSYKYAGFWMRFWAYLVDLIVIFSINGFILSPLKFMNEGTMIQLGYWTVNGLVAATVYYLYFLLMTKFFSQTIGKMVFGLKVVNEKEGPLKWTDLIFREIVGRLIYNVLGIMKLLYIVVAFTNEKQGVHDMIGHTRVVHLN